MKYRIMHDNIDMPQNMCFYLGERERVFINLVKDAAFVQIQIAERGICQVFAQHIEYLEKKEWLYGEEESRELLKAFAKEYGIM